MENTLKFFFLAVIVSLSVFIQSWWGISVFGVKPNFALAAVIASSFFIFSFWEGFLLVALAALILKFSPGFAAEISIFSLIGAGAIIIKNYFPWQHFLSNLFLITAATLVFYLILAPNLILSEIFAKELFLNVVLGGSIFALLSFMKQNKLV